MKLGVVLKEFTTFATFIRSFSNVILPMFNKLGLVLKEFLIHRLAYKEQKRKFTTLFYSMSSLISSECGDIPKEFPTFPALIKPFCAVNTDV